MVKVVKNTGNQPIGHIKIKPNPVKVIKLPSSGEGSTQVNWTKLSNELIPWTSFIHLHSVSKLQTMSTTLEVQILLMEINLVTDSNIPNTKIDWP